MKLVILGATGGTGLEIVRQATERGHSVTALVRSPERLKLFWDRITIKRGDLLDSPQLEGAIKGQDAVLSAFGPRVPISKTDANLLERFAVALTDAMAHAGVATDRQALHREVSGAGRPLASFRLQDFARRCGRLHGQVR